MPSRDRDGDVRSSLTQNAQFTQLARETLGDRREATKEDLQAVEEVLRMATELGELGSSGLKRTGGYVDEEFLPQLRGRKAIQVFKEMSENDPLAGAMLFAITMLLRNVEYTVKPGGKGKQDALAAKLVETSMHDMEHTWDEFITEVLSMLPFGWSWHEQVFKMRRGRDYKGGPASRHKDGLIGWAKLPIRAQETWQRWIFDDAGDVAGMVQMAPPHYKSVVLPMERSLLFRYRARKNNPEGTSLLRNAYRPWYFKKRIEEFESIGVERDLAGLPLVKVPAEYLRAKKDTPQGKIVQEFTKMVKSIRRNEQEGLVFPAAYDQDTKQPLFDFSLVSSSGGRQFPTDPIIQRYEQRILMSVLSDFIMVGHSGGGSYSMHTDKSGIFRTALNSIAQTIADTMNRQAIPRLMAINGFKLEDYPEIVPTDVDSPDISQLAQFMTAMAGMGVQWFPDAEMEKFIRKTARLPQLDAEQEEKERQLQQRAEATRFLEATTEYLGARNMAVEAAMGPTQPMMGPGGPGPQQINAPAGAPGTPAIGSGRAMSGGLPQIPNAPRGAGSGTQPTTGPRPPQPGDTGGPTR